MLFALPEESLHLNPLLLSKIVSPPETWSLPRGDVVPIPMLPALVITVLDTPEDASNTANVAPDPSLATQNVAPDVTVFATPSS